ncbi:MAG: hypothetical protein JW873_01995 [Candidatus Saganbacteria bacterium]|nr:hypothetical protein [Candidatus Saganbacteria bacterium]
MLYILFTVDGDWEEYYEPALSEEARKPDQAKMLAWLRWEHRLAVWLAGGRLVHLVHTSPRARDFFLRPEFIALYREMVESRGSIGVHCHEDDPRRAYYSADARRMGRAIGFLTAALRAQGLDPLAYRAGYLSFHPNTIPVLEANGLFLDLSCEPGRYLFHGELPVSDWRGAPANFYRLDRADHRRPGGSAVIEVPSAFYVEREALLKIWRRAKELSAGRGPRIVTVLTHSYEFGAPLKRLKIALALLLLKMYGTFINAGEALALAKEAERHEDRDC